VTGSGSKPAYEPVRNAPPAADVTADSYQQPQASYQQPAAPPAYPNTYAAVRVPVRMCLCVCLCVSVCIFVVGSFSSQLCVAGSKLKRSLPQPAAPQSGPQAPF
jgi:hypothetical protein